MDTLFAYLLESVFASVILYAGYLMIRASISPAVRRICLYACIIIPVTAPLLHFSTFSWYPDKEPVASSAVLPHTDLAVKEEEPMVAQHAELPANPAPANTTIASNDGLYLPGLIMAGYGIVALFLVFRLLISIISVARIVYSSEKQIIKNTQVRIVKSADFTGATFFRWILLNQALEEGEYDLIIRHECVHRQKLHSLDTIITELHLIVFWINPIAWFIRKEFRINAELEADLVACTVTEREAYIERLVSLSLFAPGKVLTPFSAFSLRRRLRELETTITTNWKRVMPAMAMILAMAILPVACTEPMDSNERFLADKSMMNVRKITTTYISHQDDTEEKDDQIVSVAYFNPDMSLERMYNMTSYPYTSKVPNDREFFAHPSQEGLFTVMDGLSMEYAERNFLYGNDWPRLMAKAAKQGRHPKFAGRENVDSHVIEYDGDLPVQIESVWKFRGMEKFAVFENFEYEQNRITRYYEGRDMNIGGIADDQQKNQKLQIRDDTEFEYRDGNLVKMTSGKKMWTFQYDGEKMVSSEFFINDKRYNRRQYYYNENGLKLRTEIFNLYNEAEYTIKYEYEFYPDAEI